LELEYEKMGPLIFFFAKLGQVVREDNDIRGNVVISLTGFLFFF